MCCGFVAQLVVGPTKHPQQDVVGDGRLRPVPPPGKLGETHASSVLGSGLFPALYENMTSFTKPEYITYRFHDFGAI